MPIKDIEKRRQSQREWYRKHREEKLTKVKVYIREHRQEISQRDKDYERIYKEKVVAYFGTRCALCRFDGGQALKGVDMHERNGKKHHRTYGYVWRHKEDFKPVCKWCHQMVHGLLLRFNLSWEGIVQVIEVAKTLTLTTITVIGVSCG